MQYLGAEVGELSGLVVGDFGDGAGFGNQTRVGGFYAVYIGPNYSFLRAERCAQDCGGIVGAAAA